MSKIASPTSFVVFMLLSASIVSLCVVIINFSAAVASTVSGDDETNNSTIVTQQHHRHDHRRLASARDRKKAGGVFTDDNDPRTVELKEGSFAVNENDGEPPLPPLRICNREAPISHRFDMDINDKYRRECVLRRHNTNNHKQRQPSKDEDTSILLLHEIKTFGRTGNNLIEFLHALQYARDNDLLLVVTSGCWVPHLLTNMWLSIRIDNPDIEKQSPLRIEAMEHWTTLLEQLFCIKIITTSGTVTDVQIDKLVLQLSEQYKNVIQMSTKELFLMFRTNANYPTILDEYIDYQCFILRALFRYYNTGSGVNMRNKPVKDMCSVIDATFGGRTTTTATSSSSTTTSTAAAIYSVIHSRSLEGEPGIRLLEKISRRSKCDPLGALLMEPDYIKSILQPLGMLNHPILFITDHQNPSIYNKLLADPIIGPYVQLIPEDSSWVGGDITVAIMANVFIGNPASTFSGFIAKSRVALGYDSSTTVMFRAKDNNASGKWITVCEDKCIFDAQIMNAMA